MFRKYANKLLQTSETIKNDQRLFIDFSAWKNLYLGENGN